MDSLTSLSTKQKLLIFSKVVLGTTLLVRGIFMNRRKTYVLVFIAVCGALVLSSLNQSFFKATASKKRSDLSVRSLVPNLVVVDARLQRDVVVLSLRNDYDKIITAFAVSSSGITTRTEMIGTDGVLAPGAIKTKFYEPPTGSSPENGITVQAAVFADDTTEGSVEIAKQILDQRAGERRQIDRILPILRDSKEVLDLPSKEKWQVIRSRIAQLPDLEEGESFAFRVGLSNGKNLALAKINDLEQLQRERGDGVAKSVWADMKESYEIKRTVLRGRFIGNQRPR